MSSDQPAFLPVGTEVSAKFKGAFCEAKVKKVKKTIQCRVQLKEAPFKMVQVMDDAITKGVVLELNQIVEVEWEQKKLKGVIMHIKDRSSYDVVFNDGDEKTLMRTAMVMKGGKHFDTTLDQMPLYNPEQYLNLPKGKNKKRKAENSTPSKRRRRGDEEAGTAEEEENDGDDEEKSDDSEEDDEQEEEDGKKREKRAAASAASLAIGELDQNDTEAELTSEMDSSDEKEKKKRKDDDEDKKKKDEKPAKSKDDHFEPGDTVCIFSEPANATKIKNGASLSNGKTTLSSISSSIFFSTRWYPAVVVAQTACKEAKGRNLTKREVPVRSFKDGRYMVAHTNNLVPFSYVPHSKKTTEQFTSSLRTLIDYAVLWIDNETLPKMWNVKEIYGDSVPKRTKKLKEEVKKDEKKLEKKEKKEKEPKTPKEKDRETPTTSKEKLKEKEKSERRKSVASSSSETSSEDSDDEPGEERDLFIAHLYKFHEERATPINRAPVMGGKDLDLHLFYSIVRRYGGGKKITSSKKWGRVLMKMKLEGAPGANTVTLKKAYERYLEPYFQFERTLGWTVDGRSEQMSSRRDRGYARTAFNNEQEKKKRQKSLLKKKDDETRSSKEGSIADGSNTSKRRSSSPAGSITSSEVGSTSTMNTVKEMKEESLLVKEKSAEPQPPLSETPKERKKTKELSPSKKEKKDKEKKEKEKEPRVEKIEKKEEKEKIREKRQHSTSESGSVGNSGRRPRTEDSDGEGGDTKKKRKRSVTKEKGERGGGGGAGASTSANSLADSSDSEDGHLPANCISNFYLGQNVRANYTGKWYDARVVEIKSSQTRVEDIISVLSKSEYNQETVDDMKRIVKSTRFFVHYLGWNSRYDEWIPLEKLRISVKDQHTSREFFKKKSNNRLTDKMLLVAEAFFLERCEDAKKLEEHLRKQQEANNALNSDDRSIKQPTPPLTASAIPPPPLPSSQLHSHYQQPTTSFTASDVQLNAFLQHQQHQQQQQQYMSQSMGSSRQSTPSLYNPMGSPGMNERQNVINTTPTATSGPMVNSSIGLTMSNIMKIKDPNTPVRLVAAAAAGIESRPRGRGINIRSPSRSNYGVIGIQQNAPTTSYAVPPPTAQNFVQTSNAATYQLSTPTIQSQQSQEPNSIKSPSPISALPPTHTTPVTSPQPRVRTRSRTISRGEPVAEMIMTATATEEKITMVLEEQELIQDGGLATTTSESSAASTESAKDDQEPIKDQNEEPERPIRATPKRPLGRPRKESKEEEIVTEAEEREELKLEEEARRLLSQPLYESDQAPSGSDTPPHRSDTDDRSVRAGSVRSETLASRRLMSPLTRGTSSARGIKKKRPNRFSNMVTEAKRKKKKHEDDSDEEGETDSFVMQKDTFNSMRNKMYKRMETEGSVFDISFLGLKSLEQLVKETPEDQLSDVLDNMAAELKEIYQTARSELMAFERKKRKYMQREQKKKEQSEQANNSVTTSPTKQPLPPPPPPSQPQPAPIGQPVET